MARNVLALHDILSFSDLKSVAGAGGPCITIVMDLPNPVGLEARLKNALRMVQRELAERGVEEAEQRRLLAPIDEVIGQIGSGGIWANAVVLLRSPDLFQHYFLYGQFQERIVVGDRFQVAPLLSALTHEQRFHLLALSRHNTRLLECTPHSVDEVSLGGFAPRDMRTWLNTRQPDHMLDNRSVAGPSIGNMKGVMFGMSSDRDREDLYLSHFFGDVDRGVRSLLRNHAGPLILAGVDYEVASYRRVNGYSYVLDRAVQGSPDGIPDRELHRRAREIVMSNPSAELSKALAMPERMDPSRMAIDPVEIFSAATEGRVSDLFLCDTLSGDGIAELMNTAALETLKNGGRAFTLRREEMPVAADAAAVLRF